MTKEIINPEWIVSLLNSSILSWNHKWFVYDPFSHAVFDVSPGLQWWFVIIALQIRGCPTLVRVSIETEASSNRMLSQYLSVSESATVTDTSNNILRGYLVPHKVGLWCCVCRFILKETLFVDVIRLKYSNLSHYICGKESFEERKLMHCR